jgi:2-keto-4-pentenoate hydratase/2-oxohepta-3-ene-1,7-dioic acid hydratase in catechol pathway
MTAADSGGIVGVRRDDGGVDVARREPDGALRVLCGLREFWADPSAHLAAGPDTGAATATAPADAVVVPPVLPEARVICVGLNYRSHHAEGSYAGQEFPDHPTLFARWSRSLTVDGADVPVPANEPGLDWEGEVVAYVGAPLADATPEEALDAVVGYSVFNDLTARRAQKLTSQWILGKNGDESGPLGPIVPADQVGDLRDGLSLVTKVNGTVVQKGNTADIVYTVGDTLAHVSRTFTLQPGDLLATGTPAGVGYSRTPPWLLQPGDVVEVSVDRIGTITNRIVPREP